MSAARLAFWGAVLTAVSSVAFLVGAFGTAALGPANVWSDDVGRYTTPYSASPMIMTVVPSLVIAPSFLAFVAAIHMLVVPERRHLSLLAFGAAVAYLAIVVVNYYLELSLVRPNIEAGRTDAVAILVMDNPRGAFWPIESLAYGIQGLSALALAGVFAHPGLERAIRWSFVVVGASGILSLAAGIRGMSFADPLFVVGGALWGIGLPVATILCAVFFRRSGGRMLSAA